MRGRQLGSAVFISDLATELQIGLPKLHEWIRSEVIESGHGSLDEGHWPTATEGQRASAIEHLGSSGFLSGSNGLTNSALASAMKWID